MYPHERSLVEKLKDKPFVILGVNSDASRDLVKQVSEKEKLTWRSFADQGAIVGKWNLPGTPTFYVLDHKGVIRYKWVGSPADYKGEGLPDKKAIDTALEKLIQDAERNAKKTPK